MITAYPLQYPLGYPRTRSPQSSNFKTTFAVARDELIREIERLVGRFEKPAIVISTNNELRQDGIPYAGRKQPTDCGVAVYFTKNKKQLVFACDKWDKIEDNMQAIRKTIEAIRGIERWGSSELLERAFSGFVALPEFATKREWWEVLGISLYSSKDEIISAFKAKARLLHPDVNKASDANAKMAELNEAYKEGLQQAK